MSSSEPTNLPHPDQQDRLESWKEISAYLRRSVMTAQRWEKTENLPVHRHGHRKQDSVYAYKSEIDAWWRERTIRGAAPGSTAPSVPAAGKLPIAARLPHAVGWRTRLLTAGALTLLAVLVGWKMHSARVDAMRDEAISVAEQAARQDLAYGATAGALVHAYRLANDAERAMPNNLRLAAALGRISRNHTVIVEPPNVDMYFSSVADTESVHYRVGMPATLRLPSPAILHWRAVKAGYAPAEGLLETYRDSLYVHLVPAASTPPGMVRATAGSLWFTLTHLGVQPDFEVSDYWIDKYEVTNREFAKFVEAGGYSNKRYWKEPFTRADGSRLSFVQAMASFHDRTGRTGPATWSGGTYLEGHGDDPVTGVSWYEAMAYAEFVGKSLPTVFHWLRAAGVHMNAEIIPRSNFSGRELAAVGRYKGISAVGAFDMAGNAKEWCFNATAQGRFILGGGWDEPLYMFNEADGQSPMSRAHNYGFRLVKYIEPPLPTLLRRIDYPRRDFSKEQPVSDTVFSFFRELYSYDKTPLHASVDAVDNTDERWRRERVSFDAAYNGERIIANVFIPRRPLLPLQTIIYFPGSDAIQERSSQGIRPPLDGSFVASGRALIVPVFKGTYERADGLTTDYPARTDFYRQHVLDWFKDVERTVDYVESRPDLDAKRIAYFGFSWGARLGPLFLALDPRLRVAILESGGLKFASTFPESDPFNFAPRVTVPVLMIDGRYDFFFPVETSQRPLFQLLGTPPAEKKHVVLEASHALPNIPVATEGLQWLDRYLGRVRQVGTALPR